MIDVLPKLGFFICHAIPLMTRWRKDSFFPHQKQCVVRRALHPRLHAIKTQPQKFFKSSPCSQDRATSVERPAILPTTASSKSVCATTVANPATSRTTVLSPRRPPASSATCVAMWAMFKATAPTVSKAPNATTAASLATFLVTAPKMRRRRRPSQRSSAPRAPLVTSAVVPITLPRIARLEVSSATLVARVVTFPRTALCRRTRSRRLVTLVASLGISRRTVSLSLE